MARSARQLPGIAARSVWVLGAAVLIAVISVGLVDLIPRPAFDTNSGSSRQESHEAARPLAPDIVGGLGELAVQSLLVAGIAIAGRKILRIRL